MARPLPIRDVYVALRRLLGEKAGSADTLNFAAHLIQFCLVQRGQDSRSDTRGDYYREETSLDTLPVDLAMQDGGWRVMEYENDQVAPKSQVGRFHVYEMASMCANRRYAVDREFADKENDSLSIALGWHSTSQATSHHKVKETGWDDYSGEDRESHDYDD